MELIDNLRADLAGCALEPIAIDTVSTLYATALSTRGAADWECFYYELFEQVSRISREPAKQILSSPMFESVMRILEDDLGQRLFAFEAVTALRARVASRTMLRPFDMLTAG
ncbi:MAG: hypothetical protein NVSMB31_02840 [Vulcanimicrobiaceae bacterium]